MRRPAFLYFLASLVAGCAQGGLQDSGTGRLDSGPGVVDAYTPPAPDAGDDCAVSCPAGTICRGGACVAGCSPDDPCEGGRTCCDGACVNTDFALTDCGGCGMTCAPFGNVCAAGECKCGAGEACTGTLACCDGRCADFLTDTMACGGCGVHCAAGQLCEDGVCVVPPCSPACGDGETCVDSACRCGTGPACTAGQACCGGACVDITTSTSNCGGCGITCSGGQACVSGTCTTDVPCPTPCGVGETCVAGSCRCGSSSPCVAPQQCCGGVCVNTMTNSSNCGECGNSCTSSQSCCTGVCTNTQTSVDNCGGCGVECDPRLADRCEGGACRCAGSAQCGLLCICGPFGLGCGCP